MTDSPVTSANRLGASGRGPARKPGNRLDRLPQRATMDWAALRHALGLTQDEMAVIAGVTRVAVYVWERGVHDPNGSTLERIRYYLRQPPARERLRWTGYVLPERLR